MKITSREELNGHGWTYAQVGRYFGKTPEHVGRVLRSQRTSDVLLRKIQTLPRKKIEEELPSIVSKSKKHLTHA